MTITLPRAAPRSTATRSYGQATILMRRGSGLAPADAAEVTPYLAGTTTPYPGPLYGDPDTLTPLVFPVATGADGVVALWADAPGRLELEATHPGLGSGRVVLDLEPAPAAPPPPTDLTDYYTKAEANSAFLSESEADALYLPLSYVPPASGISQADADLRYVNSAGDTMTGDLTTPTVHTGFVRSEASHLQVYAASGYVLPIGTSQYLGYPDPSLRWADLYARSFNINSGAAALGVFLSSAAGYNRVLDFRSGGQSRWQLWVNNTAETGSDAGSDFRLSRFSDASGYLGDALSLSRATGAATFGGAVTVGGPLTLTGQTTTTSATVGTASALPGVPAGYLSITVNGSARRIAFWNP